MKYNNLYTCCAAILLLLIPAVLFAQSPTFTPLVGIPGIDPAAGFNQYINALYAISISVAGLLAVIKIIIAGIKYTMSEVVTQKSDAKSEIQGALVGLIIVVSAVIVLNQINPQLTQSTLFLSPIDDVQGAGNGNGVNRAQPPTQVEQIQQGIPQEGSASVGA
jgi:hypothetical protein